MAGVFCLTINNIEMGLFKSKQERKEKKQERKEKRQDKKEKRQEKRKDRKENRKEKLANLKYKLLAPFKNMMIKALKRRGVKGVSPKDSVKDVAIAFYHLNVVPTVSGKKNFENEVFEFEAGYHGRENLDSGKAADLASKGASVAAIAAGVPIPPDAVKAVVEVIVKFIKNVTDKQKRGEMLTEGERMALDAINDAAADASNFDKEDSEGSSKVNVTDIANKIDKEESQKAGIGISGKSLAGLAAVILVVVLITRK